MLVGGGAARLILPHLAKDDEGLYTLRVFTKDGSTEHSAYLFVSGDPDISLSSAECMLTFLPSFIPNSCPCVLTPQMLPPLWPGPLGHQ